MRKIVFYLLLVFCGVLLIDFAYRNICVYAFKSSSEESGVRDKTFAVKKPYNIVILGASRAESHYRAKMIENSIKMSAYNYGSSGGSIVQQYFALINALNNDSLKLVILDLTPSQLSNKWIKERTSSFYPYYWENDTVRSIIKQIDGNMMDLLMCSSLIQYNSHLTSVFLHILNAKNTLLEENGFRPLKYTGQEYTVSKNDIEHEGIVGNGGYNSAALSIFHKLIALCNKKGVKVVVCLSPSLVLGDSDKNYLKNIAVYEKVDCWDFSNFISDPILFSDASHLNEKGATLFTDAIIKKMKMIFCE